MPGRILLADGDGTNGAVLRLKLCAASYDVTEVRSGEHALSHARNERPDVIVLDANLPGLDGYATCARFRADPEFSGVPIIMMVEAEDTANRLRALEAGADDFIVKPADELILLARIRSFRKARGTLDELEIRAATCQAMGLGEPRTEFAQPCRVGLIAGDSSRAQKWTGELGHVPAGSVDMLEPEDPLGWTRPDQCPDVLVVAGDLQRPDEGLSLLSELRSSPNTRYSAIIVVLRPGAQQQAVLALDLGASDLMYEDFLPGELALRIKAQGKRKQRDDLLRKKVDDELRLAAIDPLTELYNRRYALAHLRRIATRAHRSRRNFAVMIVDIDHFKNINDRFGHGAGDTIIRDVANRLRQNLRAGDLLARIGGDELLAVLPDVTGKEAHRISERLRDAVECLPFATRPGTAGIGVTVSAGVAMGGGDADIDALMRQADRALYKAKNNGRNRVRFASEMGFR